jgi:hypothetical protein
VAACPPAGLQEEDEERVPIVVVRFDDYKVDLRRRVLHLGYWNVEVPFKERLRRLTRSGAKQGCLTIT